jgi:hypothetical protein
MCEIGRPGECLLFVIVDGMEADCDGLVDARSRRCRVCLCIGCCRMPIICAWGGCCDWVVPGLCYKEDCVVINLRRRDGGCEFNCGGWSRFL